MGKSKPINKLAKAFMKIDLFGESAEFKINGQSSSKNIYGVIISLGIFSTVLAYAGNKFQIMLNYDDTVYQTKTLKGDIDSLEEFSFKENKFNVAFGIFDGSSTSLIDVYSKDIM